MRQVQTLPVLEDGVLLRRLIDHLTGHHRRQI